MRGLMIGRFQPFHLGHLELVKQILQECNELVICITSLQFNYQEKDPFTAGERIQMIHESLSEENIDLSKCYILAIENQFNIATWTCYLKSSLPKFDRVYSGNEYVKMLLSDSTIDVIVPKFLDREKYNATLIRNLISKDSDWQRFVPKAVAKNIININGVQRLQVISSSDTKPTEY